MLESMETNARLISNPIDIFIGDGLCKELSKLLWTPSINNQSSSKNFEKYIADIDKHIHFQCVIMARYDWGVLFIDACDASDWEISNIDEPYIYLKMQYNPKYQYKNNVKSFTYTTKTPLSFHNNVEQYRNIYAHSAKTNLTYGRWIAVSLSRYNLAKKMRSIGIMNGGEYCTVPHGSGYEDHEAQGLLDYIKPRERMGWDEYLKYQSYALSTIDTVGFGDFTHRMVESFGMGIPVIRPKLKNQTINPLLADEHYLDCGENGEYLEDCLRKIQDNYWRSKLINNGLEWYEENASPLSVNNLVLKIINEQIKFGHVYKYSNFGEDWFSYPRLYKAIVAKFPSGSHFVEIGSWKGKSTSFMAVEIANSNKNIKFDCVDTWHGSPEHGDTYRDNDILYNLFLSNMDNFKDYYNPIRMTSLEASKLYENESLDFVFIDACHSYNCVKEDIQHWLPKVKKNGVLAGHDYTMIGHPDVVRAVNDIFGENNIKAEYDCWIYYNEKSQSSNNMC
jgi:hypothetical protein